jgi:hypothetical protein
MRLTDQRRTHVSITAVLAALVCFFLPWFQLSCGTERVASLSGWQLAVGSETLAGGETKHPEVFVLLLALLVLLAFLGWSAFKSQVTSRFGFILQIAAGMFSILIPLIEFVRLRSRWRALAGSSLMGTGTRLGFWGMLISGALMTALGSRALAGKAGPDSPPDAPTSGN